MAWYDKPLDALGQAIATYLANPGDRQNVKDRSYYTGNHPKQLKVKDGTYDDNLTLNYIGLAISRSVSRLFNNGISFHLPEGAEAQQEYLEVVWDVNKQEQLLYQLGLNGGVYGTAFVKILPDGMANRLTGQPVPRLIALDPEITHIQVSPHDVDEVMEYRVEYTVENISYREVVRRTIPEDVGAYTDSWIEEHFIITPNSRRWVPDPDRPPVQWPYDFPPIIHWKNLPSLKATHGAKGANDFEWASGVQDKLNFADSNINKTIRMNAAPPTIVTGVPQEPNMSTGPGSLSWFSSDMTKVYNLTANADIMGSMSFAENLQSSIFQLMREVPPAVIQQLGSGLTNFVMRVVYADAIEKTDTKRELYGDALLELNRRLLVVAGFEGEAADPGYIEWGDALPNNPAEQIAEDTFLLANGLASKATIAEHYGVDYEAEKALLDEERQAANALGGTILRDFLAGRNTE